MCGRELHQPVVLQLHLPLLEVLRWSPDPKADSDWLEEEQDHQRMRMDLVGQTSWVEEEPSVQTRQSSFAGYSQAPHRGRAWQMCIEGRHQ